MTRRQFLGAMCAGTLSLAAGGRSDESPAVSTTPGKQSPGTGGAISGLRFPGSARVSTTMRFRFLNPLAIYPATYIWRAYPIRQAGYYTAFFWGNDGPFLWDRGSPNTYYGAHPYPDPPPNGSVHNWEISVDGGDTTNGEVTYDRWHTQAFQAWSDGAGKHHEFYWDLPRTDTRHRIAITVEGGYGNRNPPVPTLTWGDAPWNPGREVWCGILRGIQVYSAKLSLFSIMDEIRRPLSTSAGADSVWYMNLDPTPEDISDKSGRGHHPEWVGRKRPGLWTGES